MSTNLRTTELDFDQIKENLKTFLKDQDTIKDYDMEAGAMNTMLDVLAYNTFYNALQSNFVSNEMFIDSALVRDNVVSHAKSFGYLPRSAKSSRAVINIAVGGVAGNPDTITINPGVAFNTMVDELPYTFVTMSSYVATKNSSNNYVFSNIPVFEGEYLNKSFRVTGAVNERFTIPNAGLDTDSLSVRVRSVNGSTVHPYQYADNVLELDDTTKVFFLQETFGNKHEIYFGDGITGVKPNTGETVEISYRVTNGKRPNGAAKFTIAGNIAGSTRVSVATVAKASGGSDAETTEQVKKNAINYYRTQNRAVTADDFAVLIKKYGNNVKDVVVWGGEDNVPPRFGTVFACVIPEYGAYLTESERVSLMNVLLPRTVANTHIKFVNPDYIDIAIATQVYYNVLTMQTTPDTVKTQIRTNILNHSSNNLNAFSTLFKYSVIQNVIDETDICITSNLTTIGLIKEWNPKTNIMETYNWTYGNVIVPGSFYSSGFYALDSKNSQYFRDDGNGKIQRVSGDKIVSYSAGTIDYTTGYVQLSPIVIKDYLGDVVKFNVSPRTNDITGLNNNILRVKSDNVNIILTQDDRLK